MPNAAFKLFGSVLFNSAEWKAMNLRGSRVRNSFPCHPVFWETVAQSDSVQREKKSLEEKYIE